MNASLGLAPATPNWDSAVTPSRFFKFVSESLGLTIDRLESAAIRAGQRVLRSDDWGAGARHVAGSIELELQTKNMALLFEHAMGGSTTTTGTNPYVHTTTPGTLTGKGLTIQVGRPDLAGTVQPFTYPGCKISGWELGCAVGEIGRLTLNIVGKDETTATALAAVSYTAANDLLTFVHGALTIAGSTVNVRSATLTADNGLAIDRFFLGTTTTAEPLEAGLRSYTGELSADFENLTAYNRFVNGTEAALVLSFTRGTNKIEVTTNVRFDGNTPQVGGLDLLELTLPFKAVASGADSTAITVGVTSSEPTP